MVRGMNRGRRTETGGRRGWGEGEGVGGREEGEGEGGGGGSGDSPGSSKETALFTRVSRRGKDN